MIGAGWVWLTFAVASGGLALLATRFAEGWTGKKVEMRNGWGIIAFLGGGVCFLLWAGMSHYPITVPADDLYMKGLLMPVAAMLVLPVVAGFGYGLLKGASLLGAGVKAGAAALRRWFDGVRNEKVAFKAPLASAVVVRPPLLLSELEQARQKFADVDSLCNSLRKLLAEGKAFEQLGDISLELTKVRAAIEEDCNKQSALRTLLSDYLVPAEQALRLYERLLKRNVSSAQDSIREMQDKILPLMHSRIEALYDQIHVADIAQLATVASTFEVARNLEVKLEAEAEAKL